MGDNSTSISDKEPAKWTKIPNLSCFYKLSTQMVIGTSKYNYYHIKANRLKLFNPYLLLFWTDLHGHPPAGTKLSNHLAVHNNNPMVPNTALNHQRVSDHHRGKLAGYSTLTVRILRAWYSFYRHRSRYHSEERRQAQHPLQDTKNMKNYLICLTRDPHVAKVQITRCTDLSSTN